MIPHNNMGDGKMKIPTVQDIVRKWLKEHGYTGLVGGGDGGCGCEIECESNDRQIEGGSDERD